MHRDPNPEVCPVRAALSIPALVLALVALPAAASAASPVGAWQSSTGNSIVIPADTDPLVIVLTTPAGAKSLYTGRWVPGLHGTQFSYDVGYGDRRTATFDSRDARTLLVRGGRDADATWTRTTARFPITSVSGSWRSSSGNRFTIVPSPSSTTTFDVVLTRPNGELRLYPARWVPGLEGTQFTYEADWTLHTATIDARTLAAIRVTNNGSAQGTMWTREGRAPRHDVVFGGGAQADDIDVTLRGPRGQTTELQCRPGRASRGEELEIRLGLFTFACDLDARVSGWH